MPGETLERDELLDQVLEDERAAAVQEFREREDSAIDAADISDDGAEE